MADPGAHALASLYLGQFTPSFWRWSGSGDALVWSDGTTIAIRDELEEILARLAPSGFPSLSSIALVLAACRDDWEGAASAAVESLSSRVDERSHASFKARLELVWSVMHKIAALPVELRRGVEIKTALLEAVLETAERQHSPAEAEQIVTALSEGATPARPGGLVEWAPPSLSELAQDLDAIASGADALSADALRRRLRTGLDGDVLPAEVALPDSERARKLLEQLRDDAELAGVARLARDMLATVQVPRSVSAQGDDQPVGGVSDISNRGPLHRLLISELAHDPLTFTVRIATGEALYLRREAPPWRPPARRIVFLDTGIRMWGVSRVYATAVGLALVASAGDCSVLTLRLQDGDLAQSDLTCREGLAEHLEALDPTPQPGGILERLFEIAADAAPADVVLVTHRDALADPAFRSAMADTRARQLYVASVDADGSYQLESRSQRGRKVLGRATLDLSPLLEPRSAHSQPGVPLREEGAADLPAILSVEAFPFLLSARLDPLRIATHPQRGVLALSRDGRLLHWASKRLNVGGRQLTTRVPKGTFRWLGIDDDGVARVLVHRVRFQSLALLTVDLDSGIVRRSNVGQVPRSLLCVARVGGVFALIHPERVEVVSVANATLGESLRLPSAMSWVRDRFFCTLTPAGRVWHALAWDGAELLLEPLPLPKADDAVALWDRFGHDGPWVLERDGGVRSLASDDPPLHLLPAPKGDTGFLALSRDGHRLVVQVSDGPHFLLDLEARASKRLHTSNFMRPLQPESAFLERFAPQLRRRFHSIGLDDHGNLALISRRNRIVPITLDADGCLKLGPGRSGTGRLSFLKAFAPVDSPSEARYQLRVARWPGGNRAFLDSRGLLHLMPAEGAELSIVLCDGRTLSTWSSDGYQSGSAFFLGSEQPFALANQRALDQFVAGIG